MKRETVKRVLALLICVWMTVSLLPAVAMAEEVTEDVIDDSTIEAYTSYENGEDAGVSTWYQEMEKPALTPPDYVFPVAWILIYLLMTVAFYLAFVNAPVRQESSRTNGFFINQLFLHVLWTFAFFYTGHTGLALLIVIVLNIVVFRSVYWFWRVSPVSALLLVPYQGWLLFAAWLNAGFVYLHGYTVTF